MIPITDEEAQNWPLEETGYQCSECEECVSTICGYCGSQLCEKLSCIKTHAARGCYTNLRHAKQPQPNVHPHSEANARPTDYTSHAKQEPVLDA